ncbi:uncharacterized protein [Diadema antillarum]|uniref:uncharacterized protein n=1 Tax=Diadema antillarum TaxID=105358 RepID=UPI003A8B3AEE
MISPGNIPPNAYQSLSSRVMRVPMRHTFTLEQKRILMKYFEQGMVGQSLMYQEKIQQCAQETGLEFDVVRNWIGNQRRKRRLEEVQRACMQNYIDNVPPSELSEGMSSAKMPHMLPSMNPRQTQVLFLPHMAKQHHQALAQSQQAHHSGALGDGTNHCADGTEDEGGSMQVNPMALTQSAPASQQMTPTAPPPPHSSPRMPNRAVPPFQQTQPVAGYPGSGNGSAADIGMAEMQSPPATTHQGSHPTPRSSHMSSTAQAVSPLMSAAGASGQDEEIAFHPTPIRGFFPTPRGARMLPGNAHPVHPQQRTSPPSFTMYQSMKMAPTKESPEMRHHEIRRVVEQIQISLDRLEQLGCESLLATVSTADRSAYVCGTPIALQYFSKVNKDLPMAEYIHKQVSSDVDFDPDTVEGSPTDGNATDSGESGTACDKAKDSQRDKAMTAMGQDHAKVVGGELPNADEDDMTLVDDNEGVIRAGEEVFIVSKDRTIIGTGTLYPRPHEKISLKSSPDYAE